MLLCRTYCEENSPKKSGALPKDHGEQQQEQSPAPNLCTQTRAQAENPGHSPKGTMHVVALPSAGAIWNNIKDNARPKVEDPEKEDSSLLNRASPGCEGSKPRGSWGFSNAYEREQKRPCQPTCSASAQRPSLTFSSGVGENIFSSWGCLEKSKG